MEPQIGGRRLQNVIELAVGVVKGPMINVGDLPDGMRPRVVGAVGEPLHESKENLHHIERAIVLGLLGQAAGDVAETARALGLSRKGLLTRLRRWRISARNASEPDDQE